MLEQKVATGFRIEKSYRDALAYLAAQENRSLANYIEHVLKAEIKRKVRQLPASVKGRG